MKFLVRLFGQKDLPEKDFSAFFNVAPKKEKLKLLERVVKEANEDQRRFMEEMKKIPVR
ncbi:MAG: hypothetical protein HYT27_00715 [Parcubacteria group bacterium]|nr:hypothetical protein [Parcubacteria group bacterium]